MGSLDKLMKVRKFKYNKEGAVSEREVLVVRERKIKGKEYIEGFCLSSMNGSMAEKLREAAPHMSLAGDDQIVVDQKFGPSPNIKDAMVGWRIFSKDKIVG